MAVVMILSLRKNFIAIYQKHNLMLNLALSVIRKKDVKLELRFKRKEETLKSNKNFKKKNWKRIKSRQESLELQSGRVSSNKLESGSKLSRISNNKLNVTKFLKAQTPMLKALVNKEKTKLKPKKLKFKLLKEQDYFSLMTKCKARLKNSASNLFK